MKSQTQLNMYVKTQIFTLQSTNMQPFYYLLAFQVYFKQCKVERQHLPLPRFLHIFNLKIPLLLFQTKMAKTL